MQKKRKQCKTNDQSALAVFINVKRVLLSAQGGRCRVCLSGGRIASMV
jgi:hypothetical protein